MTRIAIIGGSGIYSLLDEKEHLKVVTPYGAPSSRIERGLIGKTEVLFLPRHGNPHQIPPHGINYRANIWALRELGAERIVAINAVGSLREDYRPGDIVIPDQFIDFTKRRALSFYDGPDVYHISMADPFCPHMNRVLYAKSKESGYTTHLGGTYVCIEGPRFSTRSESKMFRQFSDIIGMTLVPEVNLADELAMCYSVLATVTDYDVWAEKPVDTEEVVRILRENEDKVHTILSNTVGILSGTRDCNCSLRLDGAKI